MVLMPLALLIVVAIATSGAISAGSAQYFVYHQAPPTADGLANQLLYVAGGTQSDVKVIDVGTMSVVDKIPVPVQPSGLAGLGMNWEVHGVVPSQDRSSIYAVGALSGGYLASAPYQMYNISTSTKAVIRSIPLGDSATNPVGYCGLEYNLNDESSNEIIAASMNAADGTLMSIGAPNLGRTNAQQQGGWSFENIATGTSTGFMSTNANGSNESSTCGVSWNADGTRGFASQMFEPLVDKVNWTTRAVDGDFAAYSTPGTSYHQSASDKAAGKLYVTSSSGNVDTFDMNTGAQLGEINIRSLTGSTTNDVHGVEIAPGNSNILYVTSRNTPDASDNMELVIDITNPAAPVLKGSVDGLAKSACGVYAIANKADYYGTMPSGLTLSKTGVRWASYADYVAGQLSVDYSVGNAGAAAKVNIVGASATNGVTLVGPVSAGTIASAASAPVTLKYNVPTGVGSFRTTVYATAQNGSQIAFMPGPMP
ncbi:MAG: hypothetical protein M1455_10765 [Actinobacteria bacterium]|nr:hypothetical protein [Actinomycetota bacterium]